MADKGQELLPYDQKKGEPRKQTQIFTGTICLFIQNVHCQGKFENKSPVAVGPLPKAHYALEAYSNETWKMVMALSSL